MSNWKRVKIGDLCEIIKGETGLASAPPGEYPLVATGADRRSCATWQFDTDAVCIPLVSSTGHGKKTLNYVHYQSGKFALGTILAAVIPKDPSVLTARFLHLYLSHFKDTVLVPLMKGAANVSLSMKEIATVEIPVPPLDEQQNLIDLIFRIEDEHQELLAETNHQGVLLKQLRQALLQEAVEGKLTTAWRKQHPVVKGDPQYDAAALLALIKAEKGLLEKNGKLRKENPLPPITGDKLFDLPDGWVWVRFSEVCDIATNCVSPFDYPDHLHLAPDNIEKFTGRLFECKTVSEDNVISVNHLFYPDMLVYSKVRPRLRKIVKVDFEGLCSADMYPLRPNINTDYLHFVMLSEYFDREVYHFDNRVKMPKINQNQLSTISIPLPPLAEQQAIVARMDSLMTVVDELEKQVAERKEKAQQLMKTVLREAFE